MKVLLGISGASGAVYGVRTGAALHARGVDLRLIVTATAWEILEAETATGKTSRKGTTAGVPLRGMGLPAVMGVGDLSVGRASRGSATAWGTT